MTQSFLDKKASSMTSFFYKKITYLPNLTGGKGDFAYHDKYG